MAPKKKTILVTGDIVLDHHLYAGKRFKSSQEQVSQRGMKHSMHVGGAMLIMKFLEEMREQKVLVPPQEKEEDYKDVDLAFGLQETTPEELSTWPTSFSTGSVWDQFDGPDGQKYWRLRDNLGYGDFQYSSFPGTASKDARSLNPHVLVIDDGGMGFRSEDSRASWPELLTLQAGEPPEWIILKLSRPFASGDLWRQLVAQWSDRLVVVITADDLRMENVRISQGLSWESTADDILLEMQTNPVLRGFQASRYMVVIMRGDGALWIENPGTQEKRHCHLLFDRERAEGDWEEEIPGKAYGYLSAVTASLAWHLKDIDRNKVDASLFPAMKAGTLASQLLQKYGHGPVKSEKPPGFQFSQIVKEMTPLRYALSSAKIPWAAERGPSNGATTATSASSEKSQEKTSWNLLRRSSYAEGFEEPLFGPAIHALRDGPSALQDAPCARFGKLLTMDRTEIESLRSLRQIMLGYRGYNESIPQKQPLSLAVFGAPGSGKSFGLKQIASGVFGPENPVLEFNLSQFKGPEDLIGAYHQVRDKVLSGGTPVVFWDEFDSRDYFWLQYLLAPMQDGMFQEGQLTHSIGKCVFIFAGGTSRDFAHFGPSTEPVPRETEEECRVRKHFVASKGPDFKSRLAGYLNVLGPNPRQIFVDGSGCGTNGRWVTDRSDLEFPIRRALLLRSILGFTKKMENETLEMDDGVAWALLATPQYRHGARSLEKLVLQMRDRGGFPLRRAHLAVRDILELYVGNVDKFYQLIEQFNEFQFQAEAIAPSIHEDWREELHKSGKSNPNDKDWSDPTLSPATRADNVAPRETPWLSHS